MKHLLPLLPLLLLAVLAALLPGCNPPDKAPAAARPPAPAPVARPQPKRSGYGSPQALLTDMRRLLVLPYATPEPADTSRVVVRYEAYVERVIAARVLRGVSPAADSAVLAAVRQLRPPEGRYFDTLAVPLHSLATADERREATTRYQGTAVRLPGEADTTFVKRVLPVSYPSPRWPGDLQALAWRPSPYGRQLVFTQRVRSLTHSNGGYGWYNTDVFVLDPYRPRTYAVQVLHLVNFGDLPDQSVDPFVADVNRDGRPDLVTLITYSRSGRDNGHWHYYRVQVWRTDGLDAAGRPEYLEDDTPYPYLEYTQDETPGPYPEEFTPATVRRLLARHWQQVARARHPAARPASPADTTQKAGAASPAESGPGQ